MQESTCPTGTMTEDECSAQNGVMVKSTLDASGCGTCATCAEDEILYRAGTEKRSYGCSCLTYKVPSKTSLGFVEQCVNYQGVPFSSDFCCAICECDHGYTPVKNNQDPEYNDKDQYCLVDNFTLSHPYSSIKNYTFNGAANGKKCGELTIAGQYSGSVHSNVYTYIKYGANVKSLTLSAGGRFEVAMTDCRITIHGGNTVDHYIFSNTGGVSGAGSVVSCQNMSGVGTKIIFPGKNSGYMYSFDQTCQDANCRRAGKEGKMTGSGSYVTCQ